MNIKDLDKKYAELIKLKCNNSDTEEDHIEADSIILELLEELSFNEVIEEYEKIDKWYA